MRILWTSFAALLSFALASSPFALIQHPQAFAQQDLSFSHLVVNGHIVSIFEFKVAPPDNCGFSHYHAYKGGFVTAIDGTSIPDPDPQGCGYGVQGQVEGYVYQFITSEDQGLHFSRVNYLHEGLGSETGRLDVDVNTLNESTGIDSGYVNIALDDSWVVKNLPVLEDFPYHTVSTDFALGEKSGSITATVQYSEYLLASVDEAKGGYTTPVSLTVDLDMIDIELCAIPYATTTITRPPTLDDVLFGDPNKTNATIQYGHKNIEAADDQCMPASMANSLQFLEETQGLPVPHEHRPGLKGDDSLVGQLDSLTNRTVTDRRNGSGTWGLEGKLKYLAENGLQDRVKVTHFGFGIPPGDSDFSATMNGRSATSTGMGTAIKYDDMFDAMQKGKDCELVYSWPGGAHAVVLVGAGVTSGAPWIMHGSDLNQSSDSDGTQQFSFEHLTDSNNDGVYELSGTNKEIVQIICEQVVPAPAGQQQAVPVAIDGQQFEVGALLTTGSVDRVTADSDSRSITLAVQTGEAGELTITLPRLLIDAKEGESDGGFMIMVDGEEAEYDEVRTTEMERELTIAVRPEAKSVVVIGTQVAPEFPFAALVMAALIATMIFATSRGRLSGIPKS
ncbi:MAG: hypothetical protein ACREAY_05260 [Nitrososphaera sp.]|uniref:hypothetical protein n=1 Tax=Nitrososphaera sp. TaxID=1971748 RepID=UPI003D6DFFC4